MLCNKKFEPKMYMLFFVLLKFGNWTLSYAELKHHRAICDSIRVLQFKSLLSPAEPYLLLLHPKI